MSGTVHMRYGGKKHSKWWKLDRNLKDAMKVVAVTLAEGTQFATAITNWNGIDNPKI